MQVRNISRKFYKNYFNLIETLNARLAYSYGIGLFRVVKVFFFGQILSLEEIVCEEQKITEQGKG